MGVVDWADRIAPQSVQGAEDWFLKNVLPAQNKFQAGATNMLRHNVNYGQNMAGQLMTVSLAHGVPTLVANPLPGKVLPLGVQVFGCDSGLLTPSVTVSSTATISGTLTTAPAGLLYLTALYPLAEQFVYLSQVSTAQNLPNNTQTALTLSLQEAIGSNISFDGTSTITFNKSGRYFVAYKVITITPGASGQLIASALSGGKEWGRQAQGTLTTVSNPTLSSAAIIPAAAGDTVILRINQITGTTLTTFSSATGGSCLEVTQLSNDASLTANVTIFVAAS